MSQKLWLSKIKRSNDLKAETTTMAKAKAESQDHGSHDQSHDKAMVRPQGFLNRNHYNYYTCFTY